MHCGRGRVLGCEPGSRAAGRPPAARRPARRAAARGGIRHDRPAGGRRGGARRRRPPGRSAVRTPAPRPPLLRGSAAMRSSSSLEAPPHLGLLVEGPRGGQVTRGADERLPEREVEVHGSGPLPRGPPPGVRGEATPMGRPARDRGTQVARPAHRGPVEAPLVDGLGCADAAQLRRAVRGQHEQRHAGVVGLDDRSVELDRSGAARAQHRGGRPVAASEPSAMNEALRSSWCVERTRSSSASARAIGVDRAPGLTARSVRPARPTRRPGSPRTSRHVGWRGLGPWALEAYGVRGCRPTGTPRRTGHASTLAHRVAGDPAAPTVALVHGFAQTGECFGPFGEALEATHRVVRVDQPGHGARSATADAGVERRRASWSPPSAPPRTWGTRWGHGVPAGGAVPPRRGACAGADRRHRRHRRHGRPNHAADRTGRRPPGSRRSGWARSCGSGWRWTCSPGSPTGPIRRGAPAEHRRGARGEPPPRRHRVDGPAVGPPR